MKLHTYLILTILLICSCSSPRILTINNNRVTLKALNAKWGIQIDSPKIEVFTSYQDRVQNRYAEVSLVTRPDWGMTILYSTQHPQITDINSATESFMIMSQLRIPRSEFISKPLFIHNFKGDILYRESFTKEIYDMEINMKRKIFVMYNNETAALVQIAKVNYTPEDEKMFNEIISSIKII